jgi:catechol-2,3-dioxygenase
MNLNHLHLHVRDLAVAEAFYEHWFGMKSSRRDAQLSFLNDAAGFDLALMEDATAPALPDLFHFGFNLPAATVLALHSRMTAAGVRIIDSLVQEEGFTAFRCADPDGNRIEIYWEAADVPL